MNTNETQNDNQIEQNIQLTDLEPVGEVKGGGDVNGDGRDDVITGATVNGHVKTFSSPGSTVTWTYKVTNPG